MKKCDVCKNQEKIICFKYVLLKCKDCETITLSLSEYIALVQKILDCNIKALKISLNAEDKKYINLINRAKLNYYFRSMSIFDLNNIKSESLEEFCKCNICKSSKKFYNIHTKTKFNYYFCKNCMKVYLNKKEFENYVNSIIKKMKGKFIFQSIKIMIHDLWKRIKSHGKKQVI